MMKELGERNLFDAFGARSAHTFPRPTERGGAWGGKGGCNGGLGSLTKQ